MLLVFIITCRMMLCLISYLFCVYDEFSSYSDSFSLMMSLTIMILGPGYLVRAIFHYLKIPLVMSVDYFHLVESLENFLTTAYKSKIIRFKMDEDPLQCRIYFLIFVESLEMIFSQYTETCEVLLDYPKI